uniref:F-box domain-containing protein n=1 Tax=Glossina pallidipes TaxID=7398 RepID=A0A1A9ZJA8_GLOPL
MFMTTTKEPRTPKFATFDIIWISVTTFDGCRLYGYSADYTEMWLEIFDSLSHEYLLQARLVCQSWCQMIDVLVVKELDLSKTNEDEIGLVDLPKFSNLKTMLMPLSDNNELFFQSLSNLTKMPTILWKIWQREAALAYLIGDKDLQKLIIQNWSGYLECLDMPQKNLTKASVRQLNFMSGKLRTLSLAIPYGLTDHDLLHSIAPKTNKRLTDFKLFLCRPRGELFCELSPSLANLTTFNCKSSGTEFTDDKWTYYFIHFKELTKLKLWECARNRPLFFQSLVDLGAYFPVLGELCCQNLDSGINCCPERPSYKCLASVASFGPTIITPTMRSSLLDPFEFCESDRTAIRDMLCAIMPMLYSSSAAACSLGSMPKVTGSSG